MTGRIIARRRNPWAARERRNAWMLGSWIVLMAGASSAFIYALQVL